MGYFCTVYAWSEGLDKVPADSSDELFVVYGEHETFAPGVSGNIGHAKILIPD